LASRKSLLTAPGLPRPRTRDGRYPVPWVSPIDNLGAKDPRRHQRVAGGMVCQVCGLRLSRRAIAFINEPWEWRSDTLPEDVGAHAMDDGLMHETCARLALANCPGLKRCREDGKLVVVEIPSGSIEAYGPDVRWLDWF
jgi:hypothetical protein